MAYDPAMPLGLGYVPVRRKRGRRKGFKCSPETRARMSAAATGRKKSPEHIAHMRTVLTGRKQSPEQVAAVKAGVARAMKADPQLMSRGRGLKGRRNPRWIKDRKLAAARKARAALFADTLRRSLFIEVSPTLEQRCGYTAAELRAHLESLFTEGMSWDNHGRWTIDHKRPVHTFPMDADPAEINALSNLRPLWAHDNWIRPKKERVQ